MPTVDAIRRITIQSSTPGVSQSTSELNNLTAAQNRVAASADQLRASMDAAQKLIDDNVSKLNALKTANDNAAGSFSGLVSGARDVTGNFADTVEHILNTINHLKLLGVAAYALSPAFRSITNSGVATALGVLPPVMSKAASSMVSFAAPALSFFGRIAAPIGVAVVAWEGLNAVINTGSGLLDKYGDAERKLYAPNVDSDLQKLTRFQNDTISPQQAQQATELASALAEAKRNISDFLKVQIDLTDPALKLQAAWVSIVSLIGKGAAALNNMSMPDSNIGNAGIFQAFNEWSKAHGLWVAGGPPGAIPIGSSGQIGPADADPAAENMRLARTKLASGLDVAAIDKLTELAKDVHAHPEKYPFNTFTGRFSQDVTQLGAPWEKPPDPNKTDSYDRAKQSIQDQIEVLKQEAEGAGKTSQAVEELKAKHLETIAAMKAGIPVTAAMDAEWKKYGDDIADLTIKINQAKVVQSESSKRDAMFMSPSDAAAFAAARQIDPTNPQAHMGDQGPQMAAMNAQLSQAKDYADSFASSFAVAMTSGKSATDALRSSISSLESSLVSLLAKAAVNSLFGSLLGGLGGPAGAGAPLNILQFSGGHAGGGDVSAGRWGIVGERGPELIEAHPSGGVSIYSNEMSKGMFHGLPGFANGGSLGLVSGFAPGAEIGEEAFLPLDENLLLKAGVR